MNNKWFYVWMVIIAILSIFTREIVTFMMLFLILLTLNELTQTFKNFYDDWKSKNSNDSY